MVGTSQTSGCFPHRCCEAGSPDADDNFTCAGRYAGYDWFEDGVPAPAANRTKSSDVLAASASAFLAARTTTPYFLEVAFQNVHGPYTTTPAFRAKYAAKKFSDAERTLFGYITEVQFTHPFSPSQAFAICMSRFLIEI